MENLFATSHERFVFNGARGWRWSGFHIENYISIFSWENGIKHAIWMHCAMGNKFLIFILNEPNILAAWTRLRLLRRILLRSDFQSHLMVSLEFTGDMFFLFCSSNFKCVKNVCHFKENDGTHSIKSRLLIKNEFDFGECPKKGGRTSQ